MSRYSLKPLAAHSDLFEVALGWDPGRGTFFVTVFGAPDASDEPDIRLWRGTLLREITQASEIVAIAARYAEIPEGLARRLELDRLAIPHNPDRPAGRLIEQLFGHGQQGPHS